MPFFTMALRKRGNFGWFAAKRDQAFYIFISFTGLIIVTHVLNFKNILTDGISLPALDWPATFFSIAQNRFSEK